MEFSERDNVKYLLELRDREELRKIFDRAYQVRIQYLGPKVYLRGLIELSNICIKNCYYCGIRRSNTLPSRYLMREDEIIESALWAFQNKYGSIVLQSGERRDSLFIESIGTIIEKIKEQTDGKLGITLSLGEQKYKVYEKWFAAGAHRYLLRIETSNKSLYEKLHPANHSFEKRKNCLTTLKKIGYQVGTGVMIGLPMQTVDDLVDDLFFFKEMDVDMIGMGPFLTSNNTPLNQQFPVHFADKEELLKLSLKMIAAARLLLKDVNIASTTALQVLKYDGREQALKCGANIIMPNITLRKYRPYYQLYDNKPCIEENSELCKMCLANRIISIGEKIGYDERGDSLHFQKTKYRNTFKIFYNS